MMFAHIPRIPGAAATMPLCNEDRTCELHVHPWRECGGDAGEGIDEGEWGKSVT
jgi:hypothetical protein